MPLASSIEQPTSPDSAASLIVSATISGASPKPFSRSAETGRSLHVADHPRLGQRLIPRNPPVTPAQHTADAPLEVASAPKENQKIACGRKQFDTLGVDYDVVTSLAEVKF